MKIEQKSYQIACDSQWCEECRGVCRQVYPGVGCYQVLGGGLATVSQLVSQLRANAKRAGWTRKRGKDLCKDCSNPRRAPKK